MAEAVTSIVREPATRDAPHYARRVRMLALAYTGLFVGSLAGVILLVWQGQLFVTLTQRSNVETLVLAFMLVFFVYLAVLSAPGTLGAARIVYYALLARSGRDAREIEQRKAESARTAHPRPRSPVTVALNLIVEREGKPGEPFRLPVADDAGHIGALEIDGARVIHHDTLGDGSNSLLAYFVEQVNQVVGERVGPSKLDIIAWKKIDDELTESYLSQATFARNLARHLQAESLWPTLWMTDDDCTKLERRLSAVCPALRDEAFLPDWEYEAEHKLPLIPEPLGIASLSRTERRADPVTSMGCAVAVVLAALLVLALLIVFPPWVPGL